MSRDLVRAKLKAAGIHFLISVLIFIGILYLILVEWYPEPFFTAEGGWNGIKLMAAVDLVLGPTLTLIIFNASKPKREIIFDLSVIAAVQVSALIWGGLQVYSERPVAFVMWEGTFYTVTEDYYDKQDIRLKELASYSDETPLIIYAETDHSVAQLERIQEYNQKKIPPYAQVHLYKSAKDNLEMVLSQQLDEEWILKNLGNVNTGGFAESEVYVFEAKAKYEDLRVVLDSKANLIEIIKAQ